MGISLKGFGGGDSGGGPSAGASISGLSALPPAAADVRISEPTTAFQVPVGSYWDTTYNSATASYANNNLEVTISASDDTARTVYSFTATEKRYWEVTLTSGSGNFMVGLVNNLHIYTAYPGDGYAWSYHCPNGRTYHNNVDVAYGSSATVGDVIGVALDMTTGKLWFSVNNVWQGGGNPETGVNPAYSNVTGTIYAAVGNGKGTCTYTANFGETAFAGTLPAGFEGQGEIAPTLSVNNVSVLETGVNATFSILLSNASTNTITVDYATSDGTAIAPGDYTSTSGTITFLPGEVSKQVNVPIINDPIPEINETFTLNLSNASVSITTATGTSTIVANDQPTLSTSTVLHIVGGATHGYTDIATGKTVTSAGTNNVMAASSGGYVGMWLGQTTSDHLTIPASADWGFNADFSIEFWIKGAPASGTYPQALCNRGPVTSNAWSIALNPHIEGNIDASMYHHGVGFICPTQPAIFKDNTWHHFALCRVGTTVTLYRDGIAVNTQQTSALIGEASSTMRVGAENGGYSSTSSIASYMREIRIVKGVSAYTGNFTPSTSLPDVYV